MSEFAPLEFVIKKDNSGQISSTPGFSFLLFSGCSVLRSISKSFSKDFSIPPNLHSLGFALPKIRFFCMGFLSFCCEVKRKKTPKKRPKYQIKNISAGSDNINYVILSILYNVIKLIQ